MFGVMEAALFFFLNNKKNKLIYPISVKKN
jgi:hypothetical protein